MFSKIQTSFNMASLLHSLKIKNVMAQLTDTEFDTFFAKLRHDFGREYLLRLVCGPIVSPSHQSPVTLVSMDTVSAFVSTIIEERDPKHQK